MKTRVTTTTTAIGGTGKETAGPPKEARKGAKPMRLQKVKGKDMALSVTNAGATGIWPATALTRRLWAKEALKEEVKEGKVSSRIASATALSAEEKGTLPRIAREALTR